MEITGKILVTGATGFVGLPLVNQLIAQGASVRVLVRSEAKAALLKGIPVEMIEGHLEDAEQLRLAVSGCRQIFHLAAYAAPWARDEHIFDRINVRGTEALLDLALSSGVERVLLTSTAGVMGPSPQPDILVDEDTHPSPPLYSPYDRSKYAAEKKAFSFIDKGLEVVIVNPSRIYGPGLLGDSNSVTRLVQMFGQGKWRFIPGTGLSRGNYVFIDDVVQGHLLAMHRGESGQRYILGGENTSYLQLFQLLRRLTKAKQKLFKIPVPVLKAWAHTEMLIAKTTSHKPMIVPAFVDKLTKDWNLSSEKARHSLGYYSTDLETGLIKTIAWLSR